MNPFIVMQQIIGADEFGAWSLKQRIKANRRVHGL